MVDTRASEHVTVQFFRMRPRMSVTEMEPAPLDSPRPPRRETIDVRVRFYPRKG